MSTRTITLTGRPPVQIDEDEWPIVAKASDKAYDNQYEFQATRVSSWGLYVRQHYDYRGRTDRRRAGTGRYTES